MFTGRYIYLNNTEYSNGNILYWMFRDCRIEDNWAVIFSQHMANNYKSEIHICYTLLTKFLDGTIRQYTLLIENLKDVEKYCKKYNFHFHILLGEPEKMLPKIIKQSNIGMLVIENYPLNIYKTWISNLIKLLYIPIIQIDAHNIVPCWIASNKMEYSARTLRPKIYKHLSIYLIKYPKILKHKYYKKKIINNNWKLAYDKLIVDKTVKPIKINKSYNITYQQYAKNILHEFIKYKLPYYNKHRNDPNMNKNSNLSPWLHFGIISSQTCVLEVLKYKKIYPESVKMFLEEIIIRKELSDNYCYYNNNYDNIAGAPKWAIDTLNKHKYDKKHHIYNLKEYEIAKTHDKLWNACQIQLIKIGILHGYLRMYWAKKILEWAPDPERAIKWAIYLNDKYAIDGRDPNGYVGCMWSICGLHDRAWKEREIYGKIRYMSYEGCVKKFNVNTYIKSIYL